MLATRCSVVLSAKALDNPQWDALAASRPFAACHPKGLADERIVHLSLTTYRVHGAAAVGRPRRRRPSIG